MGVVTLTDAWPRPGEPFTVGDLDRMPDDGHRYEKSTPQVFELVDGAYRDPAQAAGDMPFRAERRSRSRSCPLT